MGRFDVIRAEHAVIDRLSLRLSATLLLVGQLLYIVVTQFHTGGDANNHPAIFAACWPGSWIWRKIWLVVVAQRMQGERVHAVKIPSSPDN